jgi:hypothetical protein
MRKRLTVKGLRAQINLSFQQKNPRNGILLFGFGKPLGRILSEWQCVLAERAEGKSEPVGYDCLNHADHCHFQT